MTALAKYDSMCRAIDAAYKVDEVKDIRDKALALETYAKQAHNVEAERRACEIRLRAERKAGQLSAKLKPSNPGKRKKHLGSTIKPKRDALKEAGISKGQAHQWEKLAKIADKDFEKALANVEAKPTTNGLIRASDPPPPKTIHVLKETVWLWGALRDLNRMAVPRDPDDVLVSATPEMLKDICHNAPRVAAWLNRIGKDKP